MAAFWLLAVVLLPDVPQQHPPGAPAPHDAQAECGRRGRGPGRAGDRPQDSSPVQLRAGAGRVRRREPAAAASRAGRRARARQHRRPRRDPRAARRRARGARVHRRPRGGPRRRPGVQRAGRAGRHRAAPVRGGRQPSGGLLAGGDAAAGTDPARARPSPPARQAHHGRRRRDRSAWWCCRRSCSRRRSRSSSPSSGPVFFRQTRIGKGQKPFTIVKFRTMVADAEERKAEVAHLNAHRGLGDGRMFKIPDDPRVTPVGRLLRRTLRRRVPAALERAARRDEPGRPAPADSARAPVRERLGPAPARPDARVDRPLAGLRPQRGDVHQMLVLDYLYVTNWSLWGDVTLIMRTVPALLGKTRGAA